jgi:dTDP-4-dehydrorhamnose reductase
VLSVKALVVGRTGQLAHELLNCVPPDIEATSLDRGALDLMNPASVELVVTQYSPNVVINAAAYTAVDFAESESNVAYAVNESAVAEMARVCASVGCRFVHLSTDFVFDGRSNRPYRADDPPNPISVYGASKLAGEQRISTTPQLDWRVIRTAWVYSARGKNFLLTMLRLFAERAEVRVVADQVGTPTSAASLAACVWKAAIDDGPSALMHYTDAGIASWYDFAVAIYEEGIALGLLNKSVSIVPIKTAEYPTPARRPHYSVLDKSETLKRLSIAPVHWRIKLREVMKGLCK